MEIKAEGKLIYDETRRILREAQLNNRLVLFVGAGASVDPGMPTWSRAIEQIAEKLPLIDSNKTYDSLKIPQFYYNERGKKEYTQLMRDIFLYGKTLKTTILHKKLIECQAETIITTNYDHLIEQASEENAEVRFVISKDSDLPYKNTSRELIKMHGDFENDNFVLKEDDYLNYSYNFKLIETYIKSLLGSKVILFVGYSMNDPDVKQILTWAKDALKDDFQSAYLILTKCPKNDIERDYFRNLGINIIYTSELVGISDESSHIDELVAFFDYLSMKDEEKILDKIYNDLKPFYELNYVYGKYIKKALLKIDILCETECIDLSDSNVSKSGDENKFKHLLWSFLHDKSIPKDMKLDETDLKKLYVIEAIIKKSCFKNVRRIKNRKVEKINLRRECNEEIGNLIYQFNYKKLDYIKRKNATQLGCDSPELYMQQAYICSLMNDYYTSYGCLKNASKIYYKNKNYMWYFIAEFNRKYVGNVCINTLGALQLSDKELEKLNTEVNAIKLERILETIPDLGNNHNEFLVELSNFKVASNLFYDMFSDSMRVQEQAKTAYSFFSGIAAFEKMRSSAQDYNDYETCNYIILDRYSEVRSIFLLYLRSIISSVMSEDISDKLSDNEIFSTGNIKKDKLAAFDIYIMLRYLNHSDLKKLVKEYEINFFPIDDEAMKYIEEIEETVFEAWNFVNHNFFSQNIFWNYLELISYIEISEELALKVIKHLGEQSNANELVDNKDSINRIVVNICKLDYFKNSELAESILLFINNLLDLSVKDSANFNYFKVLINNLAYFCKQGGNIYNDANRIDKLISICGKKSVTELFTNCGSDVQNLILNIFKEWIPDDNEGDYCLYCEAVLAEIISPNVDTENLMYSLIKREAVKIQNDKVIELNLIPQDYGDLMRELINLFLINRIINVDGLKECVENFGDSMSRWLIGIDDFDYNNFDCEWLEVCRDVLMSSIASNSNAKTGILNAYKRQHASKNVSSKIDNIIIKYFI